MSTFPWMRARGFGAQLDPVLAAHRPLSRIRPRSVARRLLVLLYAVDQANPRLISMTSYPLFRALAGMPWVRPAMPLPLSETSEWVDVLRHLLVQVRYPLPRWVLGLAVTGDPVAVRILAHLGVGGDLRAAPELPPMTRREAHQLWCMSRAVSPVEAVRRVQVHCSGGGHPLAEAIAGSQLRYRQADEAWWREAILWISGAGFDLDDVAQVVDWLGMRSRSGLPVPARWGRRRALEAVHAWHRSAGRCRPPLNQPLPEAVFKPMTWQAHGVAWSMRQLRTTQALVDEGRALCHCVASYGWRAVQGQTTLWSLRADGLRALTVEVLPSGRVVQARGLRNRKPTRFELDAVRHWAAMRGVEVQRT